MSYGVWHKITHRTLQLFSSVELWMVCSRTALGQKLSTSCFRSQQRRGASTEVVVSLNQHRHKSALKIGDPTVKPIVIKRFHTTVLYSLACGAGVGGVPQGGKKKYSKLLYSIAQIIQDRSATTTEVFPSAPTPRQSAVHSRQLPTPLFRPFLRCILVSFVLKNDL